MLAKNIKYYRLKQNLTKKALADKIGVTPMAITNYENGSRQPNIETIRALANALEIRVTDFLVSGADHLNFCHGKFRKGSNFSIQDQEYIKEYVEEYFGRFFQVVEILGGTSILGTAPVLHSIEWIDDCEESAQRLRKYLGVSESGPINNLVQILENNGILICYIDVKDKQFSGMNGTVNGIPYLVINQNMSMARLRSTIIHEIAHFAFDWPDDLSEAAEEKIVTSISGAFLFPKNDAIRELGYRRTLISKAMTMTCREYGISMFMLVKRARMCNIINDSVEKKFYIAASKAGWRTKEPDWGFSEEEPLLFKQLVFQAVTENEISVQKGAELLRTSYNSVAESCYI